MTGATARRYINETVHGTSKAANVRLVEILNGKNQGTYVRPTKGTLREHIDKWLETCAKQRVSPKTFDGYTWQVAQIPKAFGDRRLSSIRGEDVQQFYSELLEREFSPKTIRQKDLLVFSRVCYLGHKEFRSFNHDLSTVSDRCGTL